MQLRNLKGQDLLEIYSALYPAHWGLCKQMEPFCYPNHTSGKIINQIIPILERGGVQYKENNFLKNVSSPTYHKTYRIMLLVFVDFFF